MQLVGFLFFGFEIQPGKEYPEVKVYVPSWTCDIGDVEIGSSLDKFVSERDQTIGKSYCANLQGILSVSSFLGGLVQPIADKICSGENKARHTYVTFAYNNKKADSVTTYCSPDVSAT
jgi:hypothetical protein